MSNQPHIEQLRNQLKDALYLDLDDFGLEEQERGELFSSFAGIRLKSAFQPIYGGGEIYGYEALLRPFLGETQAISPEFAFSFADQSGLLIKFDRICRTLHVLNFRKIYAEYGLLFLNVHPELLLNVTAHGRVFERILHSNSIPTHRIVIEIPEGRIQHDKQLIEAVSNYRELGYRIAIDGFGQQHSNLNRLWKLAPEFVKLDNSLIQDAERHPHVKKILPHLVDIINTLGTRTIIKGIETQAQLDIAVEAENTLLQGNYLGHPTSATDLSTSNLIPRLFAAA